MARQVIQVGRQAGYARNGRQGSAWQCRAGRRGNPRAGTAGQVDQAMLCRVGQGREGQAGWARQERDASTLGRAEQ